MSGKQIYCTEPGVIMCIRYEQLSGVHIQTPARYSYMDFRGLQSSSTAELMMKRAQRQKKLHTKAVRRKKLEGQQ